MWITYNNVPTQMRCLTTNGIYYDLAKPSSFNCEIDGPPLGASSQIEAVNVVFAALLVTLSVIWGVRKIYETLISNPRGE